MPEPMNKESAKSNLKIVQARFQILQLKTKKVLNTIQTKYKQKYIENGVQIANPGIINLSIIFALWNNFKKSIRDSQTIQRQQNPERFFPKIRFFFFPKNKKAS